MDQVAQGAEPENLEAMRSRKRRPRYTVNVAIKAYDLSKAGTAMTLTIREDAQAEPALIGTVEIGQGTFGWRPVNSKRFKRMDWRTFARWLSERL